MAESRFAEGHFLRSVFAYPLFGNRQISNVEGKAVKERSFLVVYPLPGKGS